MPSASGEILAESGGDCIQLDWTAVKELKLCYQFQNHIIYYISISW